MPFKLLSFDAALAHTGWAFLVNNGKAIAEYGVIETAPDSRLDTGQDHLRRVGILREQTLELLHRFRVAADADIFVACERTDWTRGRSSSRESWIVETGARESLGIATTAIFCACLELNIRPIVIGPNKWHRSLRLHAKQSVALWAAAHFDQKFEIRVVQTVARGKAKQLRASNYAHKVFDKATGASVPDHVTDAAAMGWVVLSSIQRSEIR